MVPGLDLVLLAQIERMGREIPWEVRQVVRDRVREYLYGADMQVVRAAALAAGSLEDSAAVGALIELLGHDSTPLRQAAHHALKQATGLGFTPNRERWTSWYATETAWFERKAPRVVRKLSDHDPLVVIATLRELASHRFQRPETVELVQASLGHSDPRVRRAACTALWQLGSRRAVPGLVACTDDRDAGVAAEARRALTGLGGPTGS